MKKILITVFVILVMYAPVCAQSWGKYTLIAPTNSSTVKLVDLQGATYKSWSLSGNNGYSTVLTPDRCIVRLVSVSGPGGGNDASRVEKVDWNGNVLWRYTIALHHDICVLPNGNVLATVRTTATSAELSEVGFTGGTTTVSNSLTYDKIVEIDGVNQQIVWEWRFIDHLIQNVKSSASNYGNPADNPHRFDIQIRGDEGYNDWMHLNGIDYYPQRDQIVISCKYLKEIFVIDHSTTTAQAKTSVGGLSGKGGDFLFRWGYPSNYGKTNTNTNTFGTIHNASWAIGETYQAQSQNPMESNYHAFAGQICVFSNTNVAGMTIEPPYEETGFLYKYTTGNAFAPNSYFIKRTISGRSTNMGSAQPLPNGNMLIFGGGNFNTVYEINSSGTTVWSNNTVSNCAKVARYSEEYVNGDYAEICRNVTIGGGNLTEIVNITTDTKWIIPTCKAGQYTSILNLPYSPDNMIEIYDLMGRTIAAQKGSVGIIMPYAKGIHIIRINNHSQKIIIH